MKKILSFTLCVFMLLSFTGCFESEPTKEINQDYQNTSSEKIIEEEFSLNETAVFEDLKITATEKKETIGKSFFEASEGKIFVGVKFTIENISDEEQHISSLLLFGAYADDIKCDYSFSAVSSFDGGTLDGSIAPGKKWSVGML